jgi:hypothetical protein
MLSIAIRYEGWPWPMGCGTVDRHVVVAIAVFMYRAVVMGIAVGPGRSGAAVIAWAASSRRPRKGAPVGDPRNSALRTAPAGPSLPVGGRPCARPAAATAVMRRVVFAGSRHV